MFLEPLGNWRQVSVRESKRQRDWAEEVAHLLDIDFPDAEVVVLVCDNFETHKIGALYKRFPAEQAHAYARRLEIHYTPKHGSWLNAAEIELSVLSCQCLDERMADLQTRRKVKAWLEVRKENLKSVPVSGTLLFGESRTPHSRLPLTLYKIPAPA